MSTNKLTKQDWMTIDGMNHEKSIVVLHLDTVGMGNQPVIDAIDGAFDDMRVPLFMVRISPLGFGGRGWRCQNVERPKPPHLNGFDFWSFLGNQHWSPQKVYSLVLFCLKHLNQHFSETNVTTDWFWSFLANQHLAPWAHQITTQLFFKFSWKPTPSPQQSLQFGFVFFAKTEWTLFKNQGHYRLVY